MELELYYFYFHKKYAEKLINLFNIRSYQSTWYCRNSHETAIKDETELRKYFFDHTQDSSIPNFEYCLEIININKKLQAGAYTSKSASKAWKNLPFNTPLWFDSDEINNMQSLMENPSPDSQYLKTISRCI